MYTVKLINGNMQKEIFWCDTIEEANICAQYYMRNRTETMSIVYIVPCFDAKNYDEEMALNCVKKCQISEEDDLGWVPYFSTRTNKEKIRKVLNELSNLIEMS